MLKVILIVTVNDQEGEQSMNEEKVHGSNGSGASQGCGFGRCTGSFYRFSRSL